MDVLDGIAQTLADAGCGAYSTTETLPAGQTPITLGGMPQRSGPAIALATYTGAPAPDSRNGWEYPRLQVRVRSSNPLQALALERSTFEVLQTLAGDLPGGVWHLQDCYAIQSNPEPLGRDDNGQWEYVRNYQLTTYQN